MHIQPFFIIKSFNSGMCMPSRLHQVPISWKTKPTGTRRYRLNTEQASIWPCSELEKKYWQDTTVTNAADFPLLWPGASLRTERQPGHGLQLRWAPIQTKMLPPWHTHCSACSSGLHPTSLKQSIPQFASDLHLAGKQEPWVCAHSDAHSYHPSCPRDRPWPLSGGERPDCGELVCLWTRWDLTMVWWL